MNIRKARQKDVDAIHKIAEKTWEDAYRSIISEETIQKVIEDWYDKDSLESQLDRDLFYVAEEERILGFAQAGRIEESDKAKLYRIYVDPESQRNGVGSRLYEEIEEELAARGIEKSNLKSSPRTVRALISTGRKVLKL